MEAKTIRCACAGWSESVHFEHGRRHCFAWRGPKDLYSAAMTYIQWLIHRCDWFEEYKLPYDKTYNTACPPSEDSDQPGHLPSLISLGSLRKLGSLTTLERTSKTRIRLGRCHFVGFVMPWLISVMTERGNSVKTSSKGTSFLPYNPRSWVTTSSY